MSEPLLFEMTDPGRRGFSLPEPDVPEKPHGVMVPGEFLRSAPADLPELTEAEVVRHFIRLSVLNHHVDKAFYPLGSCTMKYNPESQREHGQAFRIFPGASAAGSGWDTGDPDASGRPGTVPLRNIRHGRHHPAAGCRRTWRNDRNQNHPGFS